MGSDCMYMGSNFIDELICLWVWNDLGLNVEIVLIGVVLMGI